MRTIAAIVFATLVYYTVVGSLVGGTALIFAEATLRNITEVLP